jgi:hypothetical protein
MKAYAVVNKSFAFLTQFRNMESTDVRSVAEAMVKTYSSDLDPLFPNEFIHFTKFVEISNEIPREESPSVSKLLNFLRRNKLQSTFPNVDVVLRVYVSRFVSNCSGERSFSALKRVKMSFVQQCLNHVSTPYHCWQSKRI